MRRILLTIGVAFMLVIGMTAALATTALAEPNLVPICHYDHGGPPHTVWVNENAVDAHLNPRGNGVNHQGDYLGPCQGDTTTGVTTTVVTTDVTTTQETTPTTPSDPGCVETGAGKDGEEGNDSCAPRNTNPTPTTPVSDDPVTPTDPATTDPVVTTPEAEEEPTPDPAPEEELEEEVEEQAKANAEYELAAGRDPNRVSARQGELPHTGFPVWIFMILGAGLVGTGTFLVRR